MKRNEVRLLFFILFLIMIILKFFSLRILGFLSWELILAIFLLFCDEIEEDLTNYIRAKYKDYIKKSKGGDNE